MSKALYSKMKLSNRKLNVVLILLTLSGITGCSTAKHLYAQLFYNFETLDTDSSILYEGKSKNTAIESSRYFRNAILKVENEFGGKLQAPIKMYVFTNQKRFANYSNGSIRARAGGSNEGIYISPRMSDELETLPGVIVHELVHTYLLQLMGQQRYRDELPSWFKEGIAVVISKGAGAEGVDLHETIEMMINGNTFSAKNNGDLFYGKHPVGMPSRVFYLQSGLFVQYIRKKKPEIFQRFISYLKTKSFKNAFYEVYGVQIGVYWNEFLSGLAEYNKKINTDIFFNG